MKIRLNTAVVDNGGVRLLSGEVVGVGDKPEQISRRRASVLIVGGSATDLSAATKPPAASEPPDQD